MKSESFVLSKPMLSLLEEQGITIATPVQKEIIPAIIEGRDVIAQSETGSGKTLSFAIPIIEQLFRRDGLQALILVPTRELCAQITGEFVKYSHGKHLGIVSVYGGVSINKQAEKLRTANIIIATPGRLLDLIQRRVAHLETIRYLVFDEADRMLDMGFIKDIERILQHLPPKRQTMLFSATVSKEIEVLSHKYLHNPKHVRLANVIEAVFLQQTYYQTTPESKLGLLVELLKHDRHLVLVFCNRKHITAKLARKLTTQGIQARCLHGDMSQPQRERVTSDFRQKKFNVLIATDVAARGLHIDDISHVYNYEIPKDVESYTHRVGRTARAGKKGEAISLVATEEEKKFFKQILFTYRGSIALKEVKGFSSSPERTYTRPAERKEKPDWKKKFRRFVK
jgi:ATP-dependent RNA helicase DeaD